MFSLRSVSISLYSSSLVPSMATGYFLFLWNCLFTFKLAHVLFAFLFSPASAAWFAARWFPELKIVRTRTLEQCLGCKHSLHAPSSASDVNPCTRMSIFRRTLQNPRAGKISSSSTLRRHSYSKLLCDVNPYSNNRNQSNLFILPFFQVHVASSLFHFFPSFLPNLIHGFPKRFCRSIF